MKTYAYTARDASGALKRGTLKAIDRVTALTILKSQALVPVAVEESTESPVSRLPGMFGKRALLLAAGVVALVAAVGLTLWLKPKAAQERVEKPQPVRVAEPKVPAPQPVVATPAVEPEGPAAVPAPLPAVQAPAPVETETPSLVPPKRDTLASRKPTQAERVLVPGLKRNGDTNAPNPYATFKTRSERMISMMIKTKPGERILDVSLGRDFDKDFAAALDNTIEIYQTDDEEMAAHKEDVAFLKEEMRKLVKDGQSAEEILTTYRNQHNEVADFRDELQRQLSALKKEGKLKEAEAFAKEANKLLEPYGTRPLTVMPSIRKKN